MVVPKQNIDLIPTGDDNVAVQPVPLSSTSVSTQTEDSYISGIKKNAFDPICMSPVM